MGIYITTKNTRTVRWGWFARHQNWRRVATVVHLVLRSSPYRHPTQELFLGSGVEGGAIPEVPINHNEPVREASLSIFFFFLSELPALPSLDLFTRKKLMLKLSFALSLAIGVGELQQRSWGWCRCGHRYSCQCWQDAAVSLGWRGWKCFWRPQCWFQSGHLQVS